MARNQRRASRGARVQPELPEIEDHRVWTDAHDEMLRIAQAVLGNNWAMIRIDARFPMLHEWTNRELRDKFRAHNPAGFQQVPPPNPINQEEEELHHANVQIPPPITQDSAENVEEEVPGVDEDVLAAFEEIQNPPTLLEQTKRTNNLLEKICDKMDILVDLLLVENEEDNA